MKWFSLVLASSFLAMPADAFSQEDVVNTLAAARTQWLEEVNFKCKYTVKVRNAAAPSVTDVFAENYFDQQPVHSTGVLCKLGNKTRISVEYPNGSRELNSDDNRQRILNPSLDYIANSDVLLTFHPSLRKENSKATTRSIDHVVFERTIDPNTQKVASRLLQKTVNPLFPRGDSDFDMLEAAGLPNCKAVVTEVERGSEHLTVLTSSSCIIEGQALTKNVRTRWRTDASIPVVDRIEESIDEKDAGHLLTTYIELFDFQPCPNGLVPRRIVHAVSVDGVYEALEWRSADLGEYPPTPDDFILTVAPNVPTLGLKSRPTLAGEIVLDMNILSVSDLIPEGDIEPEVTAESLNDDKEKNLTGTIFFWANCTVVIALVAAVVFQRLNK